MPIFEESPEVTTPKPDIIQAFKPSFKTAVVDTRYTPQSDLLAYIEGSSWVVNYYSQILDEHDELKGHDSHLPEALQQYRRIYSMELKVTQDLANVTQDPQLNEMILQGEANVYPFLVPQEGDMFRVGIADGREGLFKITKVNRRQIFTDTAHVIEYQLIGANDPSRFADMDRKSIITYYFVKDFLLNLQNPLLLAEDYHASKKLEEYYYDMINLYMKQHHSREYMTLVIPGQAHPTYDHGVVDFVKSVFSSHDQSSLASVRQLNIGDDGAITSISLWEMLLRRDPKLMAYSYTMAGLVGRYNFHKSGLMAGMRYTGIAQIVYPEDAKLGVDYELGNELHKVLTGDRVRSNMQPLPIPPVGDDGMIPLPLIKPINMADGYVMSRSFWNRDIATCSLLEQMLLDYLDFKIISAANVLKLCDSSYTWGAVEKFYYFPLLALLIRYNLRRL